MGRNTHLHVRWMIQRDLRHLGLPEQKIDWLQKMIRKHCVIAMVCEELPYGDITGWMLYRLFGPEHPRHTEIELIRLCGTPASKLEMLNHLKRKLESRCRKTLMLRVDRPSLQLCQWFRSQGFVGSPIGGPDSDRIEFAYHQTDPQPFALKECRWTI